MTKSEKKLWWYNLRFAVALPPRCKMHIQQRGGRTLIFSQKKQKHIEYKEIIKKAKKNLKKLQKNTSQAVINL